jgi:hypothetical protein
VLALIVAARLVAADDEDRRDVESAGGHQVRRRCLVARREADHAVQLRALDRDLHVVDDQIPARQHVAAAGAGADDEVARRGRADLEGKSAGVADGVLHHLGDAVEMTEADGQLRRAVDDGDLRLEHVGIAQPQRLPLRAPYRFAGGTRLEVAPERLLRLCHRQAPYEYGFRVI